MIPEARKLRIEAAGKAEGTPFMNRHVFAIEGEPGLYRQVSREGRQGLRAGDGHSVAYIDDRLIELVRWSALEDILAIQCGLEIVGVTEEEEPIIE